MQKEFNKGNFDYFNKDIEYFFKESGNVYKGRIGNHGHQEGKGILYNSQKKVIYDGMWENGKRNGEGTNYYYSHDGVTLEHVYMGNWVDNKKSGKGKMLNHLTEDFYEGQFYEDLRDGEGIYKRKTDLVFKEFFQKENL